MLKIAMRLGYGFHLGCGHLGDGLSLQDWWLKGKECDGA